MPNILIRNVPEQVHARLIGRAEAAGVSLQQFVLGLLTQAAGQMTTQEAVAMLRARKADRRARGFVSPPGDAFLQALDEAREERSRHLMEVIDEARDRRGRLGPE